MQNLNCMAAVYPPCAAQPTGGDDKSRALKIDRKSAEEKDPSGPEGTASVYRGVKSAGLDPARSFYLDENAVESGLGKTIRKRNFR